MESSAGTVKIVSKLKYECNINCLSKKVQKYKHNLKTIHHAHKTHNRNSITPAQ